MSDELYERVWSELPLCSDWDELEQAMDRRVAELEQHSDE